MKRTPLTAVEHGLAIVAAMFLADFAQAALCYALIPGVTPTRTGFAFALSDAIPCGVALALFAREKRRWPYAILLALLAGLAIEAVAAASCVAIEALEPPIRGLTVRPMTPGRLVAETIDALYGTLGGFLLCCARRTGSLLLAARLRGAFLEGTAFAVPQSVAWALLLANRRSASPGELAGVFAFGAALVPLVPLLERAIAALFVRLGINEPQPGAD